MRSASRLVKRLSAAGLLLACAAAGAERPDSYEYQVTYRGLFSAGQTMPIADLVLETRTPGAGLNEARLEASSQAYPAVESLYPIRYRFRSWAEAANGHLVGFESFEQTGRERHRLYLRDGSQRGVRRLNLGAGVGRDEIARLDAGVVPPAVDAGRLFDRLGLLQMIRSQALQDAAEYRLPVTNGRDRLVYRVRVEGGRQLDLGGRSLPAWKVRFDGYEVDADGREQAAHRPLHIWLSRDQAKIPLLAEVPHAIGHFRIELKSPSGPGLLARSDG